MKYFIICLFTLLTLTSCKNDPSVLTKIEGKQLPINDGITPDKSIENFIKPYNEHVSKEMSQVLSYTPKNLDRTDGAMESSLGNLMADLTYLKGNAIFKTRTGKTVDFALLNYGGIRAGITAGPITMEHAFNLMPFENSLVVVELSAEKVIDIANYIIKEGKAQPVSSQFNLKITKTGYQLNINNTPITTSKTYFVLTTDYLQSGGDNMNFFKDPINLYPTDYKLRNAIIDYLSENDTIKTTLDNRITIEK